MPANQNKQVARIIKLWLPVIVCMGIIFSASSIPGRKIPPLFPFQGSIFHLVVYAMLAYFFSRALKNTYTNILPAKIIFCAIVFGVIYGITDEWHQAFVPARSVSGLDLFIDGISSFVGTMVNRWLK